MADDYVMRRQREFSESQIQAALDCLPATNYDTLSPDFASRRNTLNQY